MDRHVDLLLGPRGEARDRRRAACSPLRRGGAAKRLEQHALFGPGCGAAITEELATHHPGLARVLRNLIWSALTRLADPYASHSADRLCRALARTGKRARPGERYHYSNYGFGVLRHVLGLAAGRP
jgi:hypothetical protein